MTTARLSSRMEMRAKETGARRRVEHYRLAPRMMAVVCPVERKRATPRTSKVVQTLAFGVAHPVVRTVHKVLTRGWSCEAGLKWTH